MSLQSICKHIDVELVMFLWVLDTMDSHGKYTLENDILYFKGKLVLPTNSSWISLSHLMNFTLPWQEATQGCRTYRRLAQSLHWKGMLKTITYLVAACHICQRSKYLTSSLAGLLQPLPIPNVVWEDISLDFIVGLPNSKGHDAILVMVDRLSKYGHFLLLKHPYTTRSVVDMFTKEVIRLHGIPSSIVNDRDALFLSNFWQELFKNKE